MRSTSSSTAWSPAPPAPDRAPPCRTGLREGVPAERAKPDTMSDQQASRTLVKSAPELWAECSDAASLAKHLGAFGEIRITRLEPETAVAWEGDAARGTVRLEPSGWGTRVVLTAQDARPAESKPDRAPAPEPGPEPPALELTPEQRPGLLGRIRLRWRREPRIAADETSAEEEQVVAPPVAAQAPSEPAALTSEALHAALDSLGSAHHRPYSRA
jgi:hypothetical protein